MSISDLEAEALACMEKGPYSVTDKEHLRFTTDPHDYVSGRLYWWKEGDEYVRRDGEVNPETRGPDYDRQRLDDLIRSVVTLTQAYQQLGKQEYAARAAELVRVWFIDPSSRMNPHLEYAQIDPGTKKVRGFGIIDTYDFFYLLDSVEALVAGGIIDDSTHRQLKLWFKQLTTWLLTSKQGRKEGKRVNNHGTSYDVQVIRYLMFCGRKHRARWLLWRC
ncbi:MAG: alginate lyase family protein, partial [Deltaproteobacteria bacterium]|nr:alginate lyase family protein [Deltaproteobacteria bacterium]